MTFGHRLDRTRHLLDAAESAHATQRRVIAEAALNEAVKELAECIAEVEDADA